MKLLFVDCCISQRGKGSRTRMLCDAFLDAYRAAHPEDSVESVNLRAMTLPPFTRQMLNERDALIAEKKLSAPIFAQAWQFANADKIVVGAPFWDLTFPAQLRIYIEYISANGVTYHYDAKGCHGDCKGKHLAFLTASGNLEQKDSLGVAYWRQLCAMFGIGQYDSVFAGGLDIDPAQESKIMTLACEKARHLGREF